MPSLSNLLILVDLWMRIEKAHLAPCYLRNYACHESKLYKEVENGKDYTQLELIFVSFLAAISLNFCCQLFQASSLQWAGLFRCSRLFATQMSYRITCIVSIKFFSSSVVARLISHYFLLLTVTSLISHYFLLLTVTSLISRQGKVAPRVAISLRQESTFNTA